MLFRVMMQNVLDRVDIFQCIFFETFQIRLQAVMCLIKQISHDTRLNFVC